MGFRTYAATSLPRILTFLLLSSKFNYFESHAASVVTTEFDRNFGHHLVSTVTGLRKIGLFEGSFLTIEEG